MSAKLILFDDWGDMVNEFDLGTADGEWNINNPDEASALISSIQTRLSEREEAVQEREHGDDRQ